MSGKMDWRRARLAGKRALDFRFENDVPDRAARWLKALNAIRCNGNSGSVSIAVSATAVGSPVRVRQWFLGEEAAAMNSKQFNTSTYSRKAQALVNRLREENPRATRFELVEAFMEAVSKDETLKGLAYPDGQLTEDWLCVDCGVNTAPGIPDGPMTLREVNETGESSAEVGPDSEVYTVRDAVWKKAAMEPFGGCLCIGCLERRLGRKLKPKDFLRGHAYSFEALEARLEFNALPGTERLLQRRKYGTNPNVGRMPS